MSVNGINSNYSTQTTDAYTSTSKAAETAKQTDSASAQTGSGVVYEKSSQSATSSKISSSNSKLVSQMKLDAQNRASQLQSIVEKMITKQGNTYNSIWDALRSGNLQVDSATRLQAQKDIAEDGYWGVEQTSDRIISFAKALSNDDPEKIDKMISAFKKGYEQATGAWGDKLPGISGQTYDAVMEKFEAWRAEGNT